MIPVAVVPYYSLRKQTERSGRQSLFQLHMEFAKLIQSLNQDIETAAKVLFQNLKPRLEEDPSLVRAIQEGNQSVLEGLEQELANSLHSFGAYFEGMQVHLLSLKEYTELDNNVRADPGLYETEDGSLLLWVYSELTADEITTGGFLVGQPLLRRQGQPPQQRASGSDESPGQSRLPRTFTLERFVRTFYNVQVEVIDPNAPVVLEPEFVESEPFQELLQGKHPLGLVSPNVKIRNRLSQAIFLPFNNQHGQLTGIMALFVPRLPSLPGFIVDHALHGIIFSALFSVVVAVFVARSIARPLNRLTKTARQMARGDLSARVEVTSKDEVGQLAVSFNDMAAEVERGHTELAARAQELEDSIRLLNATNRELTRIQNHLENILANIRSGVIVIDNVGRVIRSNRAAQEILGLAEPPDADYREIVGYEEFGQIVESSLHRGISVFQREIAWQGSGETSIHLQVSTVPLLDTGRITGLVVTFYDLSNIRRLERQLVLQDRLAALGRLSAGVAHEIRNPLGVIKGSAELLRKRFGGLPEEEGLCDFILEEVARMSRVVSDFLNFARPPVPELEQIDINSVIRRCFQYLEHQDCSHHIRHEFDLSHNLPALRLDPSLFQQVLLNVFLNAHEAMPGGGTIRVRTRRLSPREVSVEVEDTGVGIPRAELQHIFDPFFTLKDAGTGLGLSVVHQIVSSHGGRIEVDSREGMGTTFRLIFPVDGESLRQSEPSSLS